MHAAIPATKLEPVRLPWPLDLIVTLVSCTLTSDKLCVSHTLYIKRQYLLELQCIRGIAYHLMHICIYSQGGDVFFRGEDDDPAA